MKFFRDNGLSIVLALLSAFTIGGMLLTGWSMYNHELTEHGATQIDLATYASSGHFLSSLFENWESEFLQMSAYVMLTAFLFQRGSAESKDPDEPAEQDEDPAVKAGDSEAPWPVRIGGWTRAAYSYSLGAALASLFLLTFCPTPPIQRRGTKRRSPHAWRACNVYDGSHGQRAILVRIPPELAIRISLHRRHCGALDLLAV